MLSTPTLIFVGAGASAEIDFPVGSSLRDKIAEILSIEFHDRYFGGPDQHFADFLTNWASSNELGLYEVWQAATSVSRSLPLAASIDSYLDSHIDHPLRSACAKLAIARLISQSENQSCLACNSDRDAEIFDFRPLGSTWYQRLWSILQTGVKPDDPKRAFANLRIVTFNYDRNIERFLQLAYSHFLDVPLDKALADVREIGIIHVYGSLGELESRPDTSRSYRTNGYTIDLNSAYKRISTYTEQVNSETTDLIHDIVRGCERIVFIGFSFGNANMRLINASVGPHQIRREIFASTYLMSPEAISHARVQLNGLFSGGDADFKFHSDTAKELFDRYAGVF